MNALSIAARVDGDLVTMPRAEFERLLEMLEEAQDILSTDSIKRKLAAGEEELMPAAFVDRMLSGESLVRLWREHRGISEHVLAEQAGIERLELSSIEQGRSEASLHALKGLAKALQVSLDDLVR